MPLVQALNTTPRAGQLTYTTTISTLSGGNTPQFQLPSGTLAYTVIYNLAGSGSLQMQESANNTLEVANQSSGSGIPQLWANIGTASTGGTTQKFEGSGAPTMVRGVVTGGSGTDILTICINASTGS